MEEIEYRSNYGIICKIMLCEEDAEVYNKKLCPEHAKEDYRDLLRSGEWPNRHGSNGRWEWGTPSHYMRNGRTKLLLYDREEKAITVEVDVIPEGFVEEKCECDPTVKHHFHFRNLMDPKSVRALSDPISLKKIQQLPGFSHFNTRGDRSPYRLISRRDYDFLISGNSSGATMREKG